MKIFNTETIRGCEARGDGNSPYLTRITLIETDRFAIYLHWFHRSDADDLHDHPWDYTSLILWRGYIEQTPEGRTRYRPGNVLKRPATWKHRVVLIDGRGAASLVFRGPYLRDWGFWVGNVWTHWVTYFREKGC